MNKMISLCSAAVVCATGAFADNNMLSARNSQKNPCACLEQGLGLPTEKKCFPAAYNAPASIAVSCGWNVDVFASFIYWHASQDDMQAGYVAPTISGSTGVPLTNGALALPDFSYNPGFKVGVGFDTSYDDWTGWVEYTWFHQKVTNSVNPPNTIAGATGAWRENDWFGSHPFFISPGQPLEISWKMNLDLIDAVFSRPYYQGTQLTVSPYAGLRALFINQRFAINSFTSLTQNNFTVTGPAFSISQSKCWSIGPVAGALGHWFLGAGFRFEGKAAGSLLYTQYTKISAKQQPAPAIFGLGPDATPIPVTGSLASSAGTNDVNVLRPVGELGVGLGWGTYLASQQYFFDLSARYDFMYLWRQNVMRNVVAGGVNSDDIGDLSLHGLTVTAAFDF